LPHSSIIFSSQKITEEKQMIKYKKEKKKIICENRKRKGNMQIGKPSLNGKDNQ
jgi:hypothetical protein